MKHKPPHKYELIKIRGLGNKIKRVIYKCMMPDCSHYLNEPQLGINRLSICWGGCGEAVLIDRTMPTKPMCDKCKERRKQARQIA